jgi:hypothetical protein
MDVMREFVARLPNQGMRVLECGCDRSECTVQGVVECAAHEPIRRLVIHRECRHGADGPHDMVMSQHSCAKGVFDMRVYICDMTPSIEFVDILCDELAILAMRSSAITAWISTCERPDSTKDAIAARLDVSIDRVMAIVEWRATA